MAMNYLSRRTFLSLSAAGVGALALSSCSQQPGASPGSSTFTVGEWGGVWNKALADLKPSIESKTGLSILDAVYGSAGGATLLEQNPKAYDVGWLIPSDAARSLKNGVVQAIDTSKVKAWSNIYPTLVDPLTLDGKQYGVPISWGASGILYRKDVLGIDLTSWKDLWRPELKGKLTIQNAPSSGGLIVMLAAAKIFGSGLKDTDTGWAKMEELKPNIQYLYNISSDPIGKLVDGSVGACVSFADFGIGLEDKGVTTVVPKEGSDSGPQLITIPASVKGKNLDAAYKYINHMLSPEAQIEWSRATQVAPANSATTLPADVQKTLIETPEMAKTLWDIDYAWFGENVAAWTEQWQKIFTS
jgi:putative spermidine/putrescine transport system substrate-binding protein